MQKKKKKRVRRQWGEKRVKNVRDQLLRIFREAQPDAEGAKKTRGGEVT
jgi:hypothetical protein